MWDLGDDTSLFFDHLDKMTLIRGYKGTQSTSFQFQFQSQLAAQDFACALELSSGTQGKFEPAGTLENGWSCARSRATEIRLLYGDLPSAGRSARWSY